MKKSLRLLLFFFMGCSIPAYAQVDSLKQVAKAAFDKQKVELWQEIAFQYLFSDPDSSRTYAEQSLTLAQEGNMDSLEAEAHMIIGFAWFVGGNNEAAIREYKEASESHLLRNDSLRSAAALSNMAATFTRMGHLESALEVTLKVLDVLKNGEDQERYGLVLGNAGMMYRQLRRNEEAKAVIKQARDVLAQHGSPRSHANTLNMLGMVWTDQDSLSLARSVYLSARALYDQDDDPLNRSSLYHNLSVLYQELGQTDSAIYFGMQAYSLSSDLENPPKMLLNASSLAELFAFQGKMDQAGTWLERGEKLSSKVNEFEPLSIYFRVLSGFQAYEGEFEESYRSARKSEQYRDSILTVENGRALTELEVKYESAKKEQDLAEAQLQIVRQQKEKERLILGGILIGILSLIAGGIYLYRQRLEREQRELEEQIRQQGVKLETTISTQEEERSRLARDLHDGIGQVLSATRLNFGSFESKIDTEGYRKALTMLDEACREVREVAHVMMPRSLEEEGLAAALQEIIDKSLSASGLQVNMEVVGKPVMISRSIEINVYRIAQELVQNTIKHAEATELHLQLIFRPDRLLLMVEDNGKGIGKNPVEGFGMANIQTRSKAIRGNFHLENSPEGGSVATLRVPLDPPS